MAKIANVALTSTFDTWRTSSNQAFDRLSQFAINNSSLYANTITANNVLRSSGNTVLGAAGKRAIVTGLLSANGRVTVGTNLAVSGNTSLSALTTSSALTYGGVTLNNAVTGTGNMVLSSSPTLVTPDLGTPASANLTNATGLPISTGVSGLGINVATFLATPSAANLASAVPDETGSGALVFATSPTLVTPALGTPASGIVTNLTGTASININGTVGATTAAAGSFTTLTTSSTVTHNGGTVNGVPYLNGSKVLTTGSALTFDGSQLGVNKAAGSLLATIHAFAAGGSSLRLDRTGAGTSTIISVESGVAYRDLTIDAANSIFSIAGSEAMRLDSSGNLGLGVTPSAWDSGWKAIDVSTVSSYTGSATGTDIWNNARVTGATPLYKTTAAASFYRQSAGAHYWFNAASGTAGNAISFTQAMTLDASGRLVVGATSTAAKFQVSGVSANTYLLIDNAAGGENYFAANISNIFQTAGTERARIDSSGNLLVGTTTTVVGSNHIVVGSNSIQGIKNDFTNLGTSAQSFGFQASSGGVYVASMKSIGGASIAFLVACTFDNSGINMFTTSLGGCTAGGVSGTISGINNDARTYTFSRNGGTGLLEVTASSTATGTTTFYLTPLNVFA